MPQHNETRGGSGRPSGAKKRPWNFCYVREYEKANGEKGTDWLRVGAAFPTEKGGYNIEVYLTIPAGSRCALFPPDEQ